MTIMKASGASTSFQPAIHVVIIIIIIIINIIISPSCYLMMTMMKTSGAPSSLKSACSPSLPSPITQYGEIYLIWWWGNYADNDDVGVDDSDADEDFDQVDDDNDDDFFLPGFVGQQHVGLPVQSFARVTAGGGNLTIQTSTIIHDDYDGHHDPYCDQHDPWDDFCEPYADHHDLYSDHHDLYSDHHDLYDDNHMVTTINHMMTIISILILIIIITNNCAYRSPPSWL